jgi:hypothetical protein
MERPSKTKSLIMPTVNNSSKHSEKKGDLKSHLEAYTALIKLHLRDRKSATQIAKDTYIPIETVVPIIQTIQLEKEKARIKVVLLSRAKDLFNNGKLNDEQKGELIAYAQLIKLHFHEGKSATQIAIETYISIGIVQEIIERIEEDEDYPNNISTADSETIERKMRMMYKIIGMQELQRKQVRSHYENDIPAELISEYLFLDIDKVEDIIDGIEREAK